MTMRTITLRTTATMAAAGLLMSAAAVCAQPTATGPGDSKACAPGSDSRLRAPGPDGPATSRLPAAGGTTGSGPDLSERLAKSDGVLCPPNVDPEIHAPAPDGGKTPVIPPPGSPGGDPSVRPK